MSTKIVVGVDGSPTAAIAAGTAAELARALEAELVVASAYGRFEVERLQAGSEEYASPPRTRRSRSPKSRCGPSGTAV